MSEAIPVLPFTEAVVHWRQRVPVSSEVFRRMTDEAKLRAFTVKGNVRAGQLKDLHKSLGDALENVTPFSEWQADARGIFARSGWTDVEPWRTRLIYRNATQQAYHAGRWNQAMELAEEAPYLQYSAILDGRQRPSHGAQDGKVYRIDSSYWRVWLPPNGHN